MYRGFAESDAEYRAWLRTIQTTHVRRIRLRVMTLEHKVLGEFTSRFLAGAITMNTNNEVTRVLALTVLDPSRSIGWEPDSPASFPIYFNRMVQVWDDRFVPGFGWVGCPAFTGPVSKFDRAGATVTLSAEGKERLALGNLRDHKTFTRKTKVTTAIRWLLRETGEAPGRIHVPDLDATLPERVTLTRMDRPWVEAKKLARSIDRVLFYDGRGHVIMRRQPRGALKPQLDRNWLASDVSIDRNPGKFHNLWIVKGPKPRGNKDRIIVSLPLPIKHDLSAHSLGRKPAPNAAVEPRWLIDESEDSKIKTRKQARNRAETLRESQLRAQSAMTFETLPLPNIEEYDLVKVVDPKAGTHAHRANTVTIPLAEGTQSWGLLTRMDLHTKKRNGNPGKGDK